MGPALTALAVSFGQDLLAAASVNYTPRYAVQVESLLAALASHSTGLNFQPQLVQAGYQPPPMKVMRPGQQDPYGQSQHPYGQSQDPYAQQQDPYAQPQDPYAQQQDPYAQPQDPYAQQQDPYAQPQDPYAQQQDPYAQQQDPYAQPQDPYAQQQDPYAQQQDPYAQQQDPYAARQSSDPRRSTRNALIMDVALLAQRYGSSVIEPLKDGATLQDGQGDPTKSDRFKVHFESNCACHVYIIGVDATGKVTPIYPDRSDGTTNPIQPNTPYTLPAGDDWWALDANKGVETIYVVASRTARPDVEAILGDLTNSPPLTRSSRRAVRQPPVLPTTRGLVRVNAQPRSVTIGSQRATIQPQQFINELQGADLAITRWFEHR
ncbi:MAG: DUF4384 domain-containing protein [Pseudomonadota bacterium]